MKYPRVLTVQYTYSVQNKKFPLKYCDVTKCMFAISRYTRTSTGRGGGRGDESEFFPDAFGNATERNDEQRGGGGGAEGEG